MLGTFKQHQLAARFLQAPVRAHRASSLWGPDCNELTTVRRAKNIQCLEALDRSQSRSAQLEATPVKTLQDAHFCWSNV